MFLVVRGRLRWLVNPVFLFLGTISYTLYLLHNEIGKTLLEDMANHGFSYWPRALTAAVAAFVTATLVTFIVEKPAMKWIRIRYAAWKDHARSP
jgi:peptidoglycan/LPS O-acetylase OafA/YrhL